MPAPNLNDIDAVRDLAQKVVADLIEKRAAHLGVKNLRTVKGAMMEANIAAGASAILNELFPNKDATKLSEAVPPIFILAPLTGRSLLAEIKREGA